MEEVYKSLLDLQEIDNEIEQAKSKVQEFGPQLEGIEGPLTQLERDAEALRSRIGDFRKDSRRLEQNAEQKRDKLRQYEERITRVRNAREEAAARTELDLVRRAADADETEALEMFDMMRKTELKLMEMEKQLERLRADVAPKREEVLAARAEAESGVATLEDRRRAHVSHIDGNAVRLYDRVRSGRNRRALAPLTVDGACGQCFNVLPVQQQSEIRQARTLMRCEACGVILYSES